MVIKVASEWLMMSDEEKMERLKDCAERTQQKNARRIKSVA
ncbi:putative Fe-S protein YdhL (DUF1289 family) [Croceifilum oryzae]|uniref:Fe-S protein YdhL (DUF1289 family) n=1 Tax=Croceifilum oryzae TaxID=1553429 RepID=A0AAJ1WU62_9BACL|nr:hypothetical protein [Croceifilum oryzae]MDQ0418738.1 putative Fe-S protein YdhL (DUF1289 family) [Croceifilum oryzae]